MHMEWKKIKYVCMKEEIKYNNIMKQYKNV